jgi:hypothetical protein
MEEMSKHKQGSTLSRWLIAIKDKAFDSIRDRVLLETKADDLRRVLECGTVATNVFCHRSNQNVPPLVTSKCTALEAGGLGFYVSFFKVCWRAKSSAGYFGGAMSGG